MHAHCNGIKTPLGIFIFIVSLLCLNFIFKQLFHYKVRQNLCCRTQQVFASAWYFWQKLLLSISHSLQMLPSVIGQFIGQVFPSSFSPQKTTWKSKYELKQHVNRYLYLICNVISNLLWKSSPSVIKTDASACTYKEGDWLWRRTLKGRIKYYDIALLVPQCLYD
jgi:hypothetical protein